MQAQVAKERAERQAKRRGVFSRLDTKFEELNQFALQNRINLNKKQVFTPPFHPYRDQIAHWKLEKLHTDPEPANPLKDKHFWLIEGHSSLTFMVEHLSAQKTIALDMEFDNIYSYYDLTCLIQISTREYNFIVDAIKLINDIPTTLANVLLDPNVLKIVFGTQDVLAFQRDYNLRLFPVIDFQNAYRGSKSLSHDPGLKDAVKDYLGIDMDKTFQRFVWRTRPIPPDAIVYAQKDSEYLLKCWEIYKLRHSDVFKNLSFDYLHHRKLMLKPYVFPKSLSAIKYFDKAWQLVRDKPDFIGLYSFSPDKKIFDNLHNWRVNTGKLNNRSLNYYLSNLDVLKVTILKPLDINSLHECATKMKELTLIAKQAIFDIIRRYTEAQNGSIDKEIPGPCILPDIPAKTQPSTPPAVELDACRDAEQQNIRTVTICEDIIELHAVNDINYVETGENLVSEQSIDCDISQESSPNPFHVTAIDKNDG
ncbi:unnamed protein product [Orchesella dallaii]|uniref:3'-5' exonuclease domain-containing protein n=1 Tax=Orchesella dallaii TaxID=48710 RepID=A0ABP1QW75_9HEXA